MEIDTDDLACIGVDSGVQEAESSNDVDAEEILLPPPERRVVRDVWPFAMPKETYKAGMVGVLPNGEQLNHFVLLTVPRVSLP